VFCSVLHSRDRFAKLQNMDEDTVRAQVERLRRLGAEPTGIEVKAAVGGLPKTTGETLSAFQNGSGGVLLLGLSESDGFVPAAGFDAARIRDALAGLCHEDMEPPIRADIEIVPFEDGRLVYLEVPALDPLRRPSHIRRRGPYGGSFIRSGDGDRHLTSYEVTQLLSNRTQPVDDRELVVGAQMADLDADAVAAFLRRLRQLPNRAFRDVTDEVALTRAGVVGPADDGTIRPTLAGLLSLGSYPQQFLPQLFVSFVALPGLSLGETLPDGTRFLDNVTCDGTIPEMLDGVIAAARKNMRKAAVIMGAGREDRYDYPVDVIRELVVNALLHRDYSSGARGMQVQVELYPDRLVVKSPGGLFGDVVPSQLGVEEVSSTRNATLARILADLPGADGMPVSENRGSGLAHVLQRLRRAGMSPPTFDVTPGHVHVTVPQHALLDPDTVAWLSALGAANLTDEQHIALALMRNTGSVSNEMLRAWGVESHAATAALRGLVHHGLALKTGGRRYAAYELADVDDEPGLFAGLDDAAPPPSPASGSRPADGARQDSSLEAVVQAIRAGDVTTKAIAARLRISYWTATRRINTLLEAGRIDQTAPPHSRMRTFVVREGADPTS
jgi:ATP-dependent DNA helicase RecG